MHCILCVVFYALYNVHWIICIVLFALYCMHCIVWIVLYALKLWNSLLSERQPDRRTKIVSYRAVECELERGKSSCSYHIGITNHISMRKVANRHFNVDIKKEGMIFGLSMSCQWKEYGQIQSQGCIKCIDRPKYVHSTNNLGPSSPSDKPDKMITYCQPQARLKPKRCLGGFIFTL